MVLEGKKSFIFIFIIMSKCRQFKGLSTGVIIWTIPNHTIKLQLDWPRQLIIKKNVITDFAKCGLLTICRFFAKLSGSSAADTCSLIFSLSLEISLTVDLVHRTFWQHFSEKFLLEIADDLQLYS